MRKKWLLKRALWHLTKPKERIEVSADACTTVSAAVIDVSLEPNGPDDYPDNC